MLSNENYFASDEDTCCRMFILTFCNVLTGKSFASIIQFNFILFTQQLSSIHLIL